MKRWQPSTLKARIALLVAACVIPVSLLTGWLLYQNYKRQEAQLEQSAIGTARALVAAVDRELQSVQFGLKGLSTSPNLPHDNLRAFYRQAHAAISLLNVTNIVIIDERNRQVLNTLKAYGEPVPPSTVPLKHRLLAFSTPVVTDLFTGPVLGTYVIGVGIPLAPGSRGRLSLWAGILPQRFASLLASQRLQQTWIVGLFDTAGIVVARTHEMEKYVGKPAAIELKRRMPLAEEDRFETTTLENIPVLTVYSRSSWSGWTVAIGIPREEITGQLRRSLLILVIVIASAFVTSLLLAYAWWRSIAAHENLRRMVDDSEDAIVIMGWNGGLRFANRAAEHLFPEGVQAQRTMDLMQQGELRKEIEIPRADGTSTVVELRVGETQWHGERAKVVNFRDITSRVTAERALQESESRFRTVVNHVPGVVFQQRLSPSGELAFTFFSEQIQETTGLNPAQALADPGAIQRLLLPEDDALLRASLRESAIGLSLWDIDVRFHHPDGSLHWLHMRAMPHHEPGGTIVWDGIAHDITDRRRLEENLRHSGLLQALAELTNGIAHNFNNVMAIIAGYGELIEADPDAGPSSKEAAAQIAAAVKRGTKLTTDLGEYSRVSSPGMQSTAVGEVLQYVFSLAQPALREGIDLRVDAPGSLWPIWVDVTRLQTAILNLILNAKDALPSGGRIELTAQNVLLGEPEARVLNVGSGRYVRISVKDNGVGMTPDVLERARNPFFTTKPVGQGTGLGLSMVDGFAKHSGGAVELLSKVNEGTEVRLWLPAGDSA